jgi:hypothetical protein
MATSHASVPVVDVEDDSEYSIKTREDRLELAIPARLIRASAGIPDEVIPVTVTNISASGMQLTTDRRFSTALPPYLGARFTIELFLDAIEIRHVTIEVVRSENRRGYCILLGCKFVHLPTQARLGLRAAVSARLTSAG